MIVAGIDMGSNATRVSIAKKPKKGFHRPEELIVKKRFPCRLGNDVFKAGIISFEKRQQLDFIFKEIREMLDEHGVKKVKCVGTSAFRDSSNGEETLIELQNKYGINVEIITGNKEATLMSRCLQRRGFFEEKLPHLHADIGGGSLELSLYHKGGFIFQESIDVGALRLINDTRSGQLVENYSQQLNAINDLLNTDIIQNIRLKHEELYCHGTGGNYRRLGRLRKMIYGKRKDIFLRTEEIPHMIGTFLNYSGYELAEHYSVRE